jgi:ribosomal protein S18 acetylase RimI-like enzyme
LFYEVNLKGKNFYLYDQSERGGIEGYASFFKTIQYIEPRNGGKKILVTSEFVYYGKGEMENIDTQYFQKLIKDSGIEILFSVEKFTEHINVLEDKTIWKNHSLDFNNIKDEIIESIENNDILCVKGIFESALPKFIEYIKNLDGLKFAELKQDKTKLTYSEREYQIKILDEAYLPQLYDIHKRVESSNDKWPSKATFLQNISESQVHGIFSSENKEKLLGFCVLNQSGEWGEIAKLAVDKPYQKKGLGTRLLFSCINLLIANNKKKIYLIVDTQNAVALRLFEHTGFEIIKEGKKHFNSGADAVEMDFVW